MSDLSVSFDHCHSFDDYIYINYLPTVSNIFNILMYADDTTLFCNFDNTQNEFTINNELDNVDR